MPLSDIDKECSRSYALAVVQRPLEVGQDIEKTDPIVVVRDGVSYVPGFTPWPANDATARMLTYYDQPFPTGKDKFAAAMLAGGVIATAHLTGLSDEAKTALSSGPHSSFVFFDEVVNP